MMSASPDVRKLLRAHGPRIFLCMPIFLLFCVIVWLLIKEARQDILNLNDPNNSVVYLRSEIYRNYGLLVFASLALPLAIWQSIVAERQVKEQSKATEQSDQQHRQSLSHNRYQTSADMLGSKSLAVRLGGIYGTEVLANDHPEEYGNQVISLLCAFARYPTEDRTINTTNRKQEHIARQDVMDAVWIVADLNGKAEINERPNLTGVDLGHGIFSDEHARPINFSYMCMIRANMLRAQLAGAKFIGTELRLANLTGAILTGADVSGADLELADLNGADLTEVIGLTQHQIDSACQNPDGDPPKNLPLGLNWDEAAAKERWRTALGDDK